MVDLIHRVKIFVYRLEGGRPDYLLLRSAQGIESLWGPVHGPLGFGEKLETAIRREVMEDLGLGRPAELLDLHLPTRWLVGDEEVIEWNFGYRAVPDGSELRGERLDPRWSDYRWAGFPVAYPALELENDRTAIMRLHTLLAAA